MVFEHRRGQRDGHKRRCVRGGAGTRGLALESSDVRAINNEGSFGVQRGDGAVANEIACQDALKTASLGRPIKRYSARAVSALATSRRLKSFFWLATVETMV